MVSKIRKYFVVTKTHSTGKIRQFSVNATNQDNAKDKISKKKFKVLMVSRYRY